MSDQIQDFLDIPRDFIKDGTQFVNRCTKRMRSATTWKTHDFEANQYPADRREFLKISQAVGVGFLVMGAVGMPTYPFFFIEQQTLMLRQDTW